MAELYSGTVSHARLHPTLHTFSYEVSMMLMDLNKLDSTFRGWWPLAGVNSTWCIATFNEANHMKNWRKDGQSLGEAVRDVVATATGRRPSDQAPVKLLTHLQYFGYCFNPISIYYVYDKEGLRVETVVAEVSNTPWMEMHLYVLHPGAPGVRDFWVTGGPEGDEAPAEGKASGAASSSQGKKALSSRSRSRSRARPQERQVSAMTTGGAGIGMRDNNAGVMCSTSPSFLPPGTRIVHCAWDKAFHVSPFMDMEQGYEWEFSEPSVAIMTKSVNTRRSDGLRLFTTSVRLNKSPGALTSWKLAWAVLLAFPFLTWRLQVWIHYEAVRLFRKGVPLHPHPTGASTSVVRTMEAAFGAMMVVVGWLRVAGACGRATSKT